MRRCIRFIAVLLLLIGSTTPAPGQGQPGQSPGTRTPQGPGQQRTPARGVPADQPVTGTAVIRGYVVSLESGAPLRRAQVRASASEIRRSRLATTDGEGRFEFRELPAGRYRLTATKGGFVTLQYGQRRPPQSGTPIELRDRQIIEKVVIGLPRGSVIAGRITDEFGEPIPFANVNAMQSRLVGGVRRWTSTGRGDRTDDLGQFRLFGLAPGEYIVSASLQTMTRDQATEASTEPTGFAPTYFPGVPSVGDALRITVGVGEENSNASFALISTHLVTVEGIVISAEGTPVTGGRVMLSPADSSGALMSMGGGNSGNVDRSGRFRITNVAPGQYVAQARVPSARNTGQIARVPVTVGGDKVENVTLVMVAGGRIRGRITTDTGEPLPLQGQRVLVFANPVAVSNMSFGGGSGNARVNPDGTFEIAGLADPRMIRVMAPSGWTLKAVIAGGRDYADTPIEVAPGQTISGVEIVLTNRVSNLSGIVSDGRGRPMLDASVVVFPDEPRLWTYASRYVRIARPDQEGRYRIDSLPAFDRYLAIAVQDLEDGQSRDPAYLTTVRPSATRFGLREGEGVTLDLKLQP